MIETTIELQFRMKDLRELYFSRYENSVFTSYTTNGYWMVSVIFLVVSSLIYMVFLRYGGVPVIALLVVSLLITLVFIMQLIVNVNKFYLWKWGVESWVKEYSKFKHCQVIVNESSIELILDEKSIIDKWVNIKSAVTEQNYITLSGSYENYVFPSKSMRNEEFDFLKKIVRDKLKSILVNES